MLIIDHKYVSLLSNRLQRFTKINSKTYNFRCPVCGDSRRNNYKARGYIYEKKDYLLFFCHNCGASMSFNNFLKGQDPTLHQEYVQEKFLERQGSNTRPVADITTIVWPKYRLNSPLRSLKKISALDHDHPAKRYVVKRHIPNTFHHKLFYCPKFKSWINSVIPDKFSSVDNDEPRLIIPFIDRDGECFGVQGRSFKPDGVRYITIMFDSDKPKVFGLDTLDRSKTIYVLEGPIDSMFVENAIAMAGSDLPFSFFNDYDKDKLTFVYDNEPRNIQIVKRMENVIERGYNVVIWPEIVKLKDINDMALNAIDYMSLIKLNTYHGLSAMARLTQWKKV